MNSSMISKIEKAHRYAQEPERVSVAAFQATFHGGHDDYQVSLAGDNWACSCHTFDSLGTCSHVMAIQQMLGIMLPEDSRFATPAILAG
ncbi:MAG TPA: SWIM zinc finger family protein [Thermomicrobiales bacterium]|nr:SWIM zinc finger family protein [Thermomicrobiales bacterium]